MQGLKAFKLRVYAQQFIGDCMPIYPLYALMFSQRSGLDNSEISLLFLSWVVFAMLAEVPTGIIADKFSRKGALVYSYLLQAVAFLTWLAFPTFWGYVIGFLIWAVGYAFSSGTFQAYLYEELKAHGDTKSFNKVYMRSQSIKLIGMVVAYTLAWFLGSSNYTLLLCLSAAGSLLAAGVVVSFPYKSKRQKGVNEVADMRPSILKKAFTEIKGSKKALAYMIALGVLTSIVGTIEEYTPLFYSEIGFSSDVIPLLLAGGLILSSILGWFAHRLARMHFATVACFVAIAGIIMFAGTFNQLGGLLAMLIFMRLIMLAQMLFGASLQHTIQDEQRATIGSLASFGGQILSIGLLGAGALLFATLSDMATYRVLALVFVGLGFGLVVLGSLKKLKVDVPIEDEVIPQLNRTL